MSYTVPLDQALAAHRQPLVFRATYVVFAIWHAPRRSVYDFSGTRGKNGGRLALLRGDAMLTGVW